METCLVPVGELKRIAFRPSGREMITALARYSLQSFEIPSRHLEMICDWLASEKGIRVSCHSAIVTELVESMRNQGVDVSPYVDERGAEQFIKSINKKHVTTKMLELIGEAYGIHDVLFAEELRTAAERLLEAFRRTAQTSDSVLLFVK